MAPPIGGKQIKLSALTYTLMLEELLDGPCTVRHLQDVSGLAYHTVRSALGTMHRRGLIHICGYEMDSQTRYTIRIFKWGGGKDAKRPRKTDSERKRDRSVRATASALSGAFSAMGAAA